MTAHVVRIGVIGHGTVGAAFVKLVKQQSDTIAARSGVRLEIARVAVRNTAAHAGSLAADVLTQDADFVVSDPTVDLVVELMGGIDEARALILKALASGKPVVTANKALIATHGAELFAAADKSGIDLLFEAAVCGGIPLIRPLRESLRGEPIRRVLGIVNGTTNYILTKMSEDGASYADALAGAQQLGYAEADPTADVEGLDAAAKISIIASIAFGANVVAGDVYSEGITKITAADIAIAHRLGYAVKLLAIAELENSSGSVSVRVHPAMVPHHHPLASVRDAFNAVVVDGEASGSLMFYGRGAGGDPTASSVLGDVIDAAINLNKGAHATLGVLTKAKLLPMAQTSCEYLIPLEVADKPGVLHAVTGIFASNNVSIRAAEQDGIGSGARLVFLTHMASEAAVQACIAQLRNLDVVMHVGALLRVIAD
ncbi:MAG: homoserine dehydrogenase [Actinobacteria bacterium]|jgi:homoserine dehydrogenase|uniref:Homoserine dehydrogenase n=1 Tax=freshwater metagenome TaxID=449393 RepID=A0A6J6QK07_9ZZZZ|nr:homoserine dehydrogenase [Actinomycetota bacterium]MSZ65834.1 homoserine dehydrogenase [Actinomycetota bacterium]MUH44508.1 homoserine dehydrogenase [Actinomycetota bacterium]